MSLIIQREMDDKGYYFEVKGRLLLHYYKMTKVFGSLSLGLHM